MRQASRFHATRQRLPILCHYAEVAHRFWDLAHGMSQMLHRLYLRHPLPEWHVKNHGRFVC